MSYGCNTIGSVNYMGSHWTDRILIKILSESIALASDLSKEPNKIFSASFSSSIDVATQLTKNQSISDSVYSAIGLESSTSFNKSQSENISPSVVSATPIDSEKALTNKILFAKSSVNEVESV